MQRGMDTGLATGVVVAREGGWLDFFRVWVLAVVDDWGKAVVGWGLGGRRGAATALVPCVVEGGLLLVWLDFYGLV